MDFDGRISRVDRDILSGDYLITFSTKELPNSIQGMKRDDYLSIKAVKKRKRRSLDANAYAWLIMSRIADVLHTSKEEVYENMLIKYGQPYIQDGHSQMITVRSDVDVRQFGLYVSCVGVGHVEGKEFKHYLVYRGSSEYDTKEMSDFIDGIVIEAKELGIDTVPRVELERMKAKWRL